MNADYFMQDNYYYLCSVKDEISQQKLDDYEFEEEDKSHKYDF